MTDKTSPLSKRAIAAMLAFCNELDHWGIRRIVSMQELEQHGLVKRITENGMIADWELTAAGEAWEPPDV